MIMIWYPQTRTHWQEKLAPQGSKTKWYHYIPGRYSLIWALSGYVPPHRVEILRRFGLKKGIDFAHFGLESGMVWTYLSFQFQMGKKEREICEFEICLFAL